MTQLSAHATWLNYSKSGFFDLTLGDFSLLFNSSISRSKGLEAEKLVNKRISNYFNKERFDYKIEEFFYLQYLPPTQLTKFVKKNELMYRPSLFDTFENLL
jgi:hypothetical protein